MIWCPEALEGSVSADYSEAGLPLCAEPSGSGRPQLWFRQQSILRDSSCRSRYKWSLQRMSGLQLFFSCLMRILEARKYYLLRCG